MARYQLRFFGDEGCAAASIALDTVSKESAFKAATGMLQNTQHSFVEVWDGENLLHLVGRADERRLAS